MSSVVKDHQDTLQDTTGTELRRCLELQRRNYHLDPNPGLEQRKKDLLALKNMLGENREAIIDLVHPVQSRLELSEGEYAPGRTSFGANDIRANKLNASLVFLSKARMEGQPLSGFASHPGLVSEFAESGAHSVIADLWASDGAQADAFVRNFYRELTASGDVATALSAAKRQYLSSHRKDGLFDWAGYQLFID